MRLPTAATRLRGSTAVVAAAAAVVTGLVTGCGVLTGEPEPAPVVLAADLALTGAGADRGAVYQRALRLRVDQVNQQGLLGERRLELRVVDNRSDPAAAADNLAELAADPAVTAVVTGGCAACVVQAAEVVDTGQVPTIALAAGDAVASPVSERRFIFQLAPDPGDTAELLAAELARAGVATVGLVTTADAGGYGADGARELADAAELAGVDLSVQEQIAVDDDADAVAAAADRVAAWQPEPPPPPGTVPGAQSQPAQPGPDELEAVVLWTPPRQAGELAVGLRRAGWQGRLFLAAAAAGDLFLRGDRGEALSGAAMVFTETLAIDQVIAASPARTARQLWWRDYLASHGGYDAYASFAADAVGVLVAAVNRIDSTERGPLRDTFEATNLDGLSGPIRFTPENHSGLQPLALTVLVAAGERWRLAG